MRGAKKLNDPKIDVTIRGDTAAALVEAFDPEPAKFEKVDGEWKLSAQP